MTSVTFRLDRRCATTVGGELTCAIRVRAHGGKIVMPMKQLLFRFLKGEP